MFESGYVQRPAESHPDLAELGQTLMAKLDFDWTPSPIWFRWLDFKAQAEMPTDAVGLTISGSLDQSNILEHIVFIDKSLQDSPELQHILLHELVHVIVNTEVAKDAQADDPIAASPGEEVAIELLTKMIEQTWQSQTT
jgi:hypothetical protein